MTTALANETWLPLIGRGLLGLIFLLSGVGKIFDYSGTGYYMTSVGVPAWLLPVVILAEMASAVMLIVGWQARLAALALAAFTALVALLFHDFWSLAADQALPQQLHFMKNLSIVGGMLFVVASGAGKWSMDGRRDR